MKIQAPLPKPADRQVGTPAQTVWQRRCINEVRNNPELRMFFQVFAERQKIGPVAKRIFVDKGDVHVGTRAPAATSSYMARYGRTLDRSCFCSFDDSNTR